MIRPALAWEVVCDGCKELFEDFEEDSIFGTRRAAAEAATEGGWQIAPDQPVLCPDCSEAVEWSRPMFAACQHHAYADDLRGMWLAEPCWVPGCPGGKPHPDMIVADDARRTS